MPFRAAIPTVSLLLGSLGSAAVFGNRPADPHIVTAVFPPWWSPASVFAAAGQAGAITEIAAGGTVVVLRAPGDGLPARAAAAGALFVAGGTGRAPCAGLP